MNSRKILHSGARLYLNWRYFNHHLYLILKNVKLFTAYLACLQLYFNSVLHFWTLLPRYRAMGAFMFKDIFTNKCLCVLSLTTIVMFIIHGFYVVMDHINVHLFHRNMYVSIVHMSCFWMISQLLQMFSRPCGRKSYMDMAWVGLRWQNHLPANPPLNFLSQRFGRNPFQDDYI